MTVVYVQVVQLIMMLTVIRIVPMNVLVWQHLMTVKFVLVVHQVMRLTVIRIVRMFVLVRL